MRLYMAFNFVFQLKAVMELYNITSVLMTMAVLLGPLAGTEVTAKSRWIDLISGITLKSRDVIGKFSNSSL
jgi:homoserine dehydrogenase